MPGTAFLGRRDAFRPHNIDPAAPRCSNHESAGCVVGVACASFGLTDSRRTLHSAGRILTILAALAMLAPINSQVVFKTSTCQIDTDSGDCCCTMKARETPLESDTSCCCREDEGADSDESTSTTPAQNDGGCPCGNCTCRVIICCGHVMPFLIAPAIVTGSNNPFINTLPVPNMNVTGDACVQGVFHPPRC